MSKPSSPDTVSHFSELADLVQRLVHPAVFDTIREPLLILSPQLDVVAANASFYRSFEENPSGVLHRSIFQLGNGQWDIPELRALLENILPLKKSFDGFEIDHDFPIIGRRIFHLNAREVVPAAAAPRFILMAFEDVTGRIWSDRRTRERTADLRRSNSDLEQFTNIAAHDLQSPLNKISSFVDLVSSSAGDRLTEKEKGFLNTAKKQTVRLSALIEDLLIYGKLTSADQRVEKVDLGAVARDVAENLAEEIAAAGAELKLEALPWINGRRFQLRQLLQNLIGNALKYRRPDVSLEIRVFAQARPDGSVEVSVQDNGIGFRPDEAELIFEPFRRLHGSGSPYKGTGMGLAICFRAMKNHGGTIRAEGMPNEGARFVASFPASSVATNP